MTEILAYGYSSEFSTEYLHNRIKMFFKKLGILVSTLDGSSLSLGRALMLLANMAIK